MGSTTSAEAATTVSSRSSTRTNSQTPSFLTTTSRSSSSSAKPTSRALFSSQTTAAYTSFHTSPSTSATSKPKTSVTVSYSSSTSPTTISTVSIRPKPFMTVRFSTATPSASNSNNASLTTLTSNSTSNSTTSPSLTLTTLSLYITNIHDDIYCVTNYDPVLPLGGGGNNDSLPDPPTDGEPVAVLLVTDRLHDPPPPLTAYIAADDNDNTEPTSTFIPFCTTLPPTASPSPSDSSTTGHSDTSPDHGAAGVSSKSLNVGQRAGVAVGVVLVVAAVLVAVGCWARRRGNRRMTATAVERDMWKWDEGSWRGGESWRSGTGRNGWPVGLAGVGVVTDRWGGYGNGKGGLWDVVGARNTEVKEIDYVDDSVRKWTVRVVSRTARPLR